MAEHAGEPVSRTNPLSYLKAIGSAIATGAFTLTGFIFGNESLADVTTNEWLWTIIAVLGSFGLTYIVPNKRTGP